MTPGQAWLAIQTVGLQQHAWRGGVACDQEEVFFRSRALRFWGFARGPLAVSLSQPVPHSGPLTHVSTCLACAVTGVLESQPATPLGSAPQTPGPTAPETSLADDVADTQEGGYASRPGTAGSVAARAAAAAAAAEEEEAARRAAAEAEAAEEARVAEELRIAQEAEMQRQVQEMREELARVYERDLVTFFDLYLALSQPV